MGEVGIEAGGVVLRGDLYVPPDALGIVLFAHGSGSSRHSPRNQFVAQSLNEWRLGTLLVDMLTPAEEKRDLATGELRFDITFLARRLGEVARWIVDRTRGGLPLGLFGASTGAAAALMTAAQHPDMVQAVVSRGGRPDLAGEALRYVEAPTLFIVGGDDATVLELNHQAMALMHCEKRLVVVPEATHLFEEPGALEAVARFATAWFLRQRDEAVLPVSHG